jgi:hypothetical protein
MFQNLKEFPQVSIRSVSKTQHSNGTFKWPPNPYGLPKSEPTESEMYTATVFEK